MTSDTVKILLVEDDELFRLGLTVRLQREMGLEIVAETGDGETAVELCDRHPLDVVLLDLGLPRMGGLEACRRIYERHPNLPILILTSREERSLIPKAIDAGVRGYCLKGIAPENLVLAIRSVAAGASWWDADATEEIRTRLFPPSEAKSNSCLTEREREILALVAAGKSNADIAEELHITMGTVRVHVHAILQKLRAGDRREAVLIARQRNLIPS